MSVALVCGSLILAGVILVLYRVIAGPSLVDRILGVNVIGTKTIVLLTLIGFLSGRAEMFIDIALAYALINFVATIAVLRYLEALARRRIEPAGKQWQGPAEGVAYLDRVTRAPGEHRHAGPFDEHLAHDFVQRSQQ